MPGAVKLPADFLPAQSFRNWPRPLSKDAFIGLAGDVVNTIEPHTESDPAALHFQFLTCFGNAVGPGPHFMQERSRHGANEFVAIVGQTAKARKGTSWDIIKAAFAVADPAWCKKCRASGLGSGEGVVNRVRDRNDGDSNDGVIDAENDKRLLVVETELASVLNVAGREGNTLSEVLRNAWDSGDLMLTTKNNPLRATGAHLSVIGHITSEELGSRLRNNDVFNGFANRFLWPCAKRSKLLPDGGNLADEQFQELGCKIARALDAARKVSIVTRSDEARQLWHEVYPKLSRDRFGRVGAATNRAEAHALRLSMIFALMDGSALIQPPHLRAALETWRYSEDSARHIFGEELLDTTAERIRAALATTGSQGMTKSEINDLFHGHLNSEKIGQALDDLARIGVVRRMTESQGKGRPAERFFLMDSSAENEGYVARFNKHDSQPAEDKDDTAAAGPRAIF